MMLGRASFRSAALVECGCPATALCGWILRGGRLRVPDAQRGQFGSGAEGTAARAQTERGAYSSWKPPARAAAILSPFVRFYMRQVIPWIGGLVSGNRESLPLPAGFERRLLIRPKNWPGGWLRPGSVMWASTGGWQGRSRSIGGRRVINHKGHYGHKGKEFKYYLLSLVYLCTPVPRCSSAGIVVKGF